MYSGAIFASTGCDTYSNACETGICADKNCSVFTGVIGPHSRAEFTFDPKRLDYYDISLMHGINVPMSMTAVGGRKNTSDPYSCTTAGSIMPQPHLPSCGYRYDADFLGRDQTTDVLFVAAPDLTHLVACTSNADCAAVPGTACGLHAGRDPTGLQTTEVVKACGKVVGVWSADEVCVYSNGAYGGMRFSTFVLVWLCCSYCCCFVFCSFNLWLLSIVFNKKQFLDWLPPLTLQKLRS